MAQRHKSQQRQYERIFENKTQQNFNPNNSIKEKQQLSLLNQVQNKQRYQSTNKQSVVIPDSNLDVTVTEFQSAKKNLIQIGQSQEDYQKFNGSTNYSLKLKNTDLNGIKQENRNIPKYNLKDQEEYYDEIQQIKQQLARKKIENQLLQTKVAFLEKNEQKYQRLFEFQQIAQDEEKQKTYSPTRVIVEQSCNNSIIIKLKKTINELKTQNLQLTAEVNRLNKLYSVTSVKELESQLKMYIDETWRLQNLILKSGIEQKEEIDEQSSYLNSSSYLQKQIKLLSEKLEFQKIHNEAEHKTLSKLKLDNATMKKQIIDLKQKALEQDNLNKSIQACTPNINKSVTQAQNEKNDVLQIQLNNSEQIIQFQQKKILDINLMLQNLRNDVEIERQENLKEKQTKEAEFKNVEQKYKTLLSIHQQLEMKKFVKSKNQNNQDAFDQDQNDTNDEHSEQQMQELQAKQLRQIQDQEQKRLNELSKIKINNKVKLIDIEPFAYELKLKLQHLKIDQDQSAKLMFPDSLIEDNMISIQEVIDVLKGQPFEMKDEQKIIQIARYFVEDNKDDRIKYDVERKQDFSIVKSVYRNFIGEIVSLSEETEQAIKKEIIDFFTIFGKSLKNYFHNIYDKKQQKYTSTEEMQKHIVQYTQHKFSDEEKIFQFMFQPLIAESMDKENIRINLIFELYADDVVNIDDQE